MTPQDLSASRAHKIADMFFGSDIQSITLIEPSPEGFLRYKVLLRTPSTKQIVIYINPKEQIASIEYRNSIGKSKTGQRIFHLQGLVA